MANNFNSDYKKLMSNIYVDDEMRERIISNVVASSNVKKKSYKKFIVTTLVPIAAAVAVLFFIVSIWGNTKKSEETLSYNGHRDKTKTTMAAGFSDEEMSDGAFEAEAPAGDCEEAVPDEAPTQNFAPEDATAAEEESTEENYVAYYCYNQDECHLNQHETGTTTSIIAIDYVITTVSDCMATGQHVNSVDRTDNEIVFELNYEGEMHVIIFGEGYMIYDQEPYELSNACDVASELIAFCNDN